MRRRARQAWAVVTKKAKTIASSFSPRDLVAGVGIAAVATGVGMIFFPAALIGSGLLLVALAVASERG